MPLREDLLTPIEGENPAGADLRYDKIYDQIKEARREEDDLIPAGDWDHAPKKADFRTVIKLAGEVVATRSKDLQLLGWLIEAQLRTEGFGVLVPGIEAIRQLQESFWDHFYPLIDVEDVGYEFDMRSGQVEQAIRLISEAIQKIPLTRNGLTFLDYRDSRAVGYEKDATSDARQEARQDAIAHGRLTAEEFDKAFSDTPKAVYSVAEAALLQAMDATRELDNFDDEKYGNNAPSLERLRSGLEELHLAVLGLLNEKRKTEPDPVEAAEPAEGEEGVEGAEGDEAGAPVVAYRRVAGPALPLEEAYQSVVQSAESLFDKNPSSPVPYLVCASLRLGEARLQDQYPAPGFAVGPNSEVRQSLRGLAQAGQWQDLMRAVLPILASECARCWLDPHRYVWQAAQETGAEPLAQAVIGNIRSLLIVKPEIRQWTLEDDTGTANPETQQWIDGVVLQ